jgi:hypothetical protein
MKFMYTNKMYLPPKVTVVWKGKLVDVGVHLLTGGWTVVHYRVLLSLQSCDPTGRLIFYALDQSKTADDNELVFF